MTDRPIGGVSGPESPTAAPGTDARLLQRMPLRAGLALAGSSALVGISAAAVAAAASVVGSTAAQTWAAMTRFSAGIAADSSWLLPTLFAAILAVLAILVGQNFVELDERDAAANQRRLVAVSWVIAGASTATLVLCFVSLAAPGSTSGHLSASTIVTALIVSAAFWGGSIVLGSPEQQLHVLSNTAGDLQQRLNGIPGPNRHGRPWLRLTSSLVVLALAAALTSVVFTATAGLFARPTEAGFLDLIVSSCICAVVAIAGTLQAAFISHARDSTISWWGELLSAGPATLVAIAPVVVIGVSLPASPFTRHTLIAILGAYSLPLAAAIAPRTLLRGWTPRGGMDGLRFRRLCRQQQQVELQRRRLKLAQRAQQQRHGWRVRR